MKMQPPQFLTDLYRDLRDRRLLLPAAALLVALIAVPVLLSTSPPEPPPPAETAVEATAATPAVLSEQVGIRNYRKRLEALKRKNPFDQKFAAPEPGAEAITGSLSESVGASVLPDTEGTGDAADAPAATASSDAGARPADAGGSGTPGAGGEPDEPKLITKLISRRIDVRVGPAGAVKKVKNVRALDFLPSGKVPVTAFLGVNENGKRAAFLLSSDIVASDGDGRCVPPSPARCFFLVLRAGEAQRLIYQPEGEDQPTTYRLKLMRIRDKVVKRIDR